MGQSRSEFNDILIDILGSRNVYYNATRNTQMSYPAIVYKRHAEAKAFADDSPYTYDVRYSVTYIDRDVDSPVIKKLAMLPKSVFDRNYQADGLNHDVYNIYF